MAAGAIGPLVALVLSGTPGQREDASTALGNLAFGNEENQTGYSETSKE